MDKLDYRLCYVGDRGGFQKCFFTSDFGNQWGDDWNDRPYEHNAGEPYDSKTDLYVVVIPSALITPEYNDNGQQAYNSRYSVEDINHGYIPWLRRDNWYREHFGPLDIYAGCTLRQFIKDIDLSLYTRWHPESEE